MKTFAARSRRRTPGYESLKTGSRIWRIRFDDWELVRYTAPDGNPDRKDCHRVA